jgi:hypothetical protein
MEQRPHTSKVTSESGASDLYALCDKTKYQLGYRQNTLFQVFTYSFQENAGMIPSLAP